MPAPILPVIPTMADGRPAPGWGGNKGYGQPTIWKYGNVAAPQQQNMGNMLSMQQMQPGAGTAHGTTPWLSVDQVQGAQPLNLQAQTFARPQLGGLGGLGMGVKPGWGWLVGALVVGGAVYLTTRPWG